MENIKKKICVLTSVHPAFDTRIFYREAKSLAKAGYEVILIAPHDKNEVVNGIKIISLSRIKNRFFRIFGTSWRTFWIALKQRAHVYHFHDPELIPIGILLKLLRKKVIYDAHEDYPQFIKVREEFPEPIKTFLSFVVGFFEKLGSYYFDLTIAAAEPLSKRLSKGIALYNFPTREILNLLKEHGKSYKERDIDLIHLGTLRKERIDFLIEVLKEINASCNASIKIAFIGLERKQIKYIKERLENINQLILKEKVPFNEVVKFLGRSKVGLNYHPLEPHLKYAIPVKVFEYMGAGCVTVCSDFPFLKSLMGNNSSIIFLDHDCKKFGKTISELIKNPSKAEKLAKLSQVYSQKFLWNRKEEEKLIEAYKKLLL